MPNDNTSTFDDANTASIRADELNPIANLQCFKSLYPDPPCINFRFLGIFFGL